MQNQYVSFPFENNQQIIAPPSVYYAGIFDENVFYGIFLEPFEDPCQDNPCSHQCMRVPSDVPSYHCVCPDQTGSVLMDDGTSCASRYFT